MSCIEPTDSGPVEATERKPFSKSQRAEIFRRANGRCQACAIKLQPNGWQADHIIEVWLGGPHTIENAQALCEPCHGVKTGRRAGVLAKVKRLKRKNEGSWPKAVRPIRSRGFPKRGEG